MVERMQYIDDKRFSYAGLFNLEDFIKSIHLWCAKNDYVLIDSSGSGNVIDASRGVSKNFGLRKEFSFLHGFEIELDLSFSGLTDEVVELEGVRHKFSKGKVDVVIDGFHATWLEHRILEKTQTTVFYAIKQIINKFIVKIFEDKYPRLLREDGEKLLDEIRAFFEAQRMITAKKRDAVEKGEAPVEEQFEPKLP